MGINIVKLIYYQKVKQVLREAPSVLSVIMCIIPGKKSNDAGNQKSDDTFRFGEIFLV